MKSPVLRRTFTLAVLLCSAATATLAAWNIGGTAYSKRNETLLLAEPKPLAAALGRAGFAEPLKVVEVRGTWLNVQGKSATGWVFSGNVADEKPTLAPPAGLTTVEASSTATSAAARPLGPVASGYAERHGARSPAADLDWLEGQVAEVPPIVVTTYMRTHQKGDYQP